MIRRRLAASRAAAGVYFVAVLVVLAVASTWVSGCILAFVGVFAFAARVPFTWPLVDAAFLRYMREPKHPPMVNAPARTRLHWVVAVLVGVFISIIIGGVAGC
jgi:hypothetical protein